MIDIVFPANKGDIIGKPFLPGKPENYFLCREEDFKAGRCVGEGADRRFALDAKPDCVLSGMWGVYRANTFEQVFASGLYRLPVGDLTPTPVDFNGPATPPVPPETPTPDK